MVFLKEADEKTDSSTEAYEIKLSELSYNTRMGLVN